MERLKQQEGSESGTYHVLLADGRLQKVEYATAPLKKEEKKEKEQNTKQEQPQYSQPQQYNKQQEEPAKQRPLVMLMPQPSGYVASIQYTDVEPINPPVYSYNKGSPLVRIVRKSPLF
ncbi:hypothetical protein AAG570_008980 [Ranatra chinensis]|uniref:Uncharacterized protein n=1 Tax=Ranatra chinensis TaxID=642074 RepID=A0ABD0YSF4_9HEMI